MKGTPETMKKYVCEARGWVYDEAVGDPEKRKQVFRLS